MPSYLEQCFEKNFLLSFPANYVACSQMYSQIMFARNDELLLLQFFYHSGEMGIEMQLEIDVES